MMYMHNCVGEPVTLHMLGLHEIHGMFFADDGFGNMIRVYFPLTVQFLT